MLDTPRYNRALMDGCPGSDNYAFAVGQRDMQPGGINGPPGYVQKQVELYVFVNRSTTTSTTTVSNTTKSPDYTEEKASYKRPPPIKRVEKTAPKLPQK